MTTTTTTAKQFHAALIANTDDFYADRVDHATFTAINCVIWTAVDRAGADVHAEVLRMLREPSQLARK